MTAAERSPRRRLHTVTRVWADALTYAVVVAVLVGVVGIVLGITTGGGLVRGKQLLFVAGWLMMGYATAKLWVSTGKQLRTSRYQSPSELSDAETADSSSFRNGLASSESRHRGSGTSLRHRQDATQFQAFVQTVPPNRWVRPPRPEKRMTVQGKILLSSIFVLLASFLMETVFGVA